MSTVSESRFVRSRVFSYKYGEFREAGLVAFVNDSSAWPSVSEESEVVWLCRRESNLQSGVKCVRERLRRGRGRESVSRGAGGPSNSRVGLLAILGFARRHGCLQVPIADFQWLVAWGTNRLDCDMAITSLILILHKIRTVYISESVDLEIILSIRKDITIVIIT